MATFFYQSNYSTQRWLGERQLCPSCNGSKPKAGFMMFQGLIQCQDCIEEKKSDQLQEVL